MCVLLVSSTKQSRGETSQAIKEFSVENEVSGMIKVPDHSSIEISENVAYSAVEQKSSLITTTPVYETINYDNSSVYKRNNEYV